MSVIGAVSALARYPVKSLAGEAVRATEVSRRGVSGDRIWALRDLDSGELSSAKTIPGLLKLAAELAEPIRDGEIPHVRVRFPDGAAHTTADDELAAAISAMTERKLKLEPLAPASDRKHYRLTKLRSPKKLRQYLGVSRGGGLPDLSVMPWSMLYTLSRFATPPGSYYDAYPIHFVTTRSLESLARSVPSGEVRVERFRPNLVIDTSSLGTDDDYPELGWAGATLAIGDVELRVIAPTFRCGMPGHAQVGMGKSPAVLKAVYRDLDSKFGAYAQVLRPGTLEVGAPVALTPAPRRGALARGAGRVSSRLKRFAIDRFMALGRGRKD